MEQSCASRSTASESDSTCRSSVHAQLRRSALWAWETAAPLAILGNLCGPLHSAPAGAEPAAILRQYCCGCHNQKLHAVEQR
jgi:hypothetical protein